MKDKIFELIESIYDVNYYRGAPDDFREYLDLLEKYIRQSHFLNAESYHQKLEEIDELIEDVSTWKSDRDRRLHEEIQEEISSLCETILTENKKIFIVHGRDLVARDRVSSLLGRLKLDYVILESESNSGMTVIEKFINNAEDCDYAVVLFTADDLGKLNAEENDLRPRVRQNVVLELGFFLAKVGRENIVVLHDVDSNIEKPSDFSGIVYEPLDGYGAWKTKLIREMKTAGIFIKSELADRI